MDDGLEPGTTANQAFFETLVSSVDAGIVACDDDGRIVFANEAVETTLGVGETSLVGTGIGETPLVDAASGAEWVDALAEPTTFERVIERDADGGSVFDGGLPGSGGAPVMPDGDDGALSVDVAEAREVAVEVTAKPVAVAGEPHALLTVRDVTERTLLERESNILDTVFESIPVYLYIKDEEGRHVRVSDYNPEARDYVGETDLDIWGEDGRESYEDDMRVIEEGEAIIDKVSTDPEWNYFFVTSKVPWRDETGEIRGLIGLTHDLSEWKRQERQLERQNERLRTVASVISHDIRNPLQVASGHLGLANEKYESDNLDAAADALDRMAALLEELLELVRHGQWVEDPDAVSLESVATDCWATATGDAGTLTFDYDLTLEADSARLRQLLENLFRNAVLHGGDDVTVRIGPLGDWSGFYVADDGPGIPDDEREKVFESGYTTSDDGTGFGLAIVQVIAEAHGWRVTVGDDDGFPGPDDAPGDHRPLGGARFEFRGVEFV
ncbi:PAS domain-containing sensor histidine kinase [Halosimplex amylolyticum]|uniref:PAS domain-containing sensor histidine kinase n=1 Tax=Halosimplex amylolyticum TaxID=3396616 RepID=UPI003F568D57